MRSRTKILISALAAGVSLAAAVPAAAQNSSHSRYEDRYDRGDRDDRDDRYERHDRDDRYENRHDDRYDRDHQYRGNANAIAQQIQQLQRRIDRNDGRDRISEREAAGLRRAIYNLRLQFRDFNRNGLNRRESQILQERINWVRSRLQMDRRDGDGRRW